MITEKQASGPLAFAIIVGYLIVLGLIVLRAAQTQREVLSTQAKKGRLVRLLKR